MLFFRLFRRSRSVYRLRRYQFTRDNRLLGGVAACDNAHSGGPSPTGPRMSKQQMVVKFVIVNDFLYICPRCVPGNGFFGRCLTRQRPSLLCLSPFTQYQGGGKDAFLRTIFSVHYNICIPLFNGFYQNDF